MVAVLPKNVYEVSRGSEKEVTGESLEQVSQESRIRISEENPEEVIGSQELTDVGNCVVWIPLVSVSDRMAQRLTRKIFAAIRINSRRVIFSFGRILPVASGVIIPISTAF